MSKILELAKRIASTGGLETKTTETISGTYDSAGQQRLLSHAYTIGANLTITNGELILSRLADNGTGMTVEFGSDVTLSGDGTLMLGDLGQGQPNQDFSASRITGELGSGVTIGSGVTFPTGCVINTVQTATTSTISTGSTSYATTSLMTTLPSIGSASNKILATLSGGSGGHGNMRTYLKLMESVNSGTYSDISGAETNNKFVSGEHQGPFSMNYLFTPNGGSGTTNSVAVRVSIKTSSGTSYLNNSSALLTLTLQEIQG